MKNSLAVFSSAILFCLLFTGCYVGTSGSWVNDHIDKQVRDEIRPLNDKLLKGIAGNNVATVNELLSPVLLEKAGKDIATIVNAASKIIKGDDFEVVDEYYTKNTNTNTSNTLMPMRSDANSYVINYLALNKDMYVSLLMPKSNSVSFMILAIYGKYDNGWKLNVLQINQYKILDKTATDNYDAAKKNYNKGYLIDAANLMFIASQVSAPGGAFFKYKKDEEMKSFYQKVIQEVNTNYHFPLTLVQIKSKPQILGIEPQLISAGEPKGIFPIIKYKSAISIDDTVAIKVENKEIQKAIGGVLKGIDQDRPIILYQAYNQLPDGKTNTKRFGIVQKLK